jgi:hypothetical protein
MRSVGDGMATLTVDTDVGVRVVSVCGVTPEHSKV